MKCEICGEDTIPGAKLCPPCVVGNTLPLIEEHTSSVKERNNLNSEVLETYETLPMAEIKPQQENYDTDEEAIQESPSIDSNQDLSTSDQLVSDGIQYKDSHKEGLILNNLESLSNEDDIASNLEERTIIFLRSLTSEQISFFREIIDQYESKLSLSSIKNNVEKPPIYSDLTTNSVFGQTSTLQTLSKVYPSKSGPPGWMKSPPSTTKRQNPSIINAWVLGFKKISIKINIPLLLCCTILFSSIGFGFLLLESEIIVADADGDGVPDVSDAFPNDPLYSTDTDGDGLADRYEWDIGTDSTSNDTDFDGLGDGLELDRGLNPLSGDSDNDGYSDSNDLYPLTNWVASIDFSGYETEINEVCQSAGSNFMTWTLGTEVPIMEWSATASGQGGASGNYVLDLPDDQTEVSVTFTIDATYTDCVLSNEEQLFWGISGWFWQHTHTASDPGGDSEYNARFTFLLSPGSFHEGNSIGSRTGDNWRDGGWLSRATINVQA